MCTLFQCVQVPLDGSSPFYCVSCVTHLGVISKLAESTFSLTVCVIHKDIEENWSQDVPLGDTTCDWPPGGHRPSDNSPLGTVIQPILSSLTSPPFKSIFLQLNDLLHIGEHQVQEFFTSCLSVQYPEQEVVSRLQESPTLFSAHHVAFPADIWMVKISHEDKSL